MVPFCRWLPAHQSESCPVDAYLSGAGARPANVRIYLGRKAGAEITRRIAAAERSITVVSPYLAPYLVERLVERHQQGIDVTLVTTEDEARKPDIARRLVRQEWELNEKARHRRRLGMCWSLASGGVAVGIALLGAGFDLRFLLALGGLPLALLAFVCSYAARVYFYDYRFVIGQTKVFQSGEPGEGRRHAKVIFVDDVAYVGAMNFKHIGLFQNLDSCVRISDPEAVQRISQQVRRLFTDDPDPGLEARFLARWLFPEPPHRPPMP